MRTKPSKEETTTPDGPVSSFAVGRISFKLENCWILDSGADVHICNDPSRFEFDRPASEDSIIFSGRTTYSIEAYGSVMITAKAPLGPISIRLVNVALVPGFFTSLVALRRLTEKGVHWDTKNERLHRAGKTFCLTQNVDDHWVLEYNKPTPKTRGSAFAASKKTTYSQRRSCAQSVNRINRNRAHSANRINRNRAHSAN